LGEKVYTINGKMYLIDDDTGDIKTIHIDSDQISPNELREIIKVLAKNQRDD
jgi:cytidylate kinase